MKIIAILLTALTSQAFSATESGYKIEAAFNFQTADKKIKSNSTFMLSQKNRAWTTLAEPQDGIALLGRLVKADPKSLQLEFIVVDTAQKNAVISTPAIVAELGKKAEITVGNDKEKIAISLTATPAQYSIVK